MNEPAVAAAEVDYVVHTLGFEPSYWELGNEPVNWNHFGVPWAQWNLSQRLNATPARAKARAQSRHQRRVLARHIVRAQRRSRGTRQSRDIDVGLDRHRHTVQRPDRRTSRDSFLRRSRLLARAGFRVAGLHPHERGWRCQCRHPNSCRTRPACARHRDRPRHGPDREQTREPTHGRLLIWRQRQPAP